MKFLGNKFRTVYPVMGQDIVYPAMWCHLKPQKSDSKVVEVVTCQKHLSEAKICMKASIYGKKCLMKVSQQPGKLLSGSNQI